MDLSPPSQDQLAYQEAKARLDPWWQTEQAAKAETDKAWYAVTFHRTWLVRAKLDDPTTATPSCNSAALRKPKTHAVFEFDRRPKIGVHLNSHRPDPLPDRSGMPSRRPLFS